MSDPSDPYSLPGSPSGYDGVLDDRTMHGAGPAPEMWGGDTDPPPEPQTVPSLDELWKRVVRAFGDECADGVKAALEAACFCVATEFRATQIGSRRLAHLDPPPRAKVGPMFRYTGVDDTAPIVLPAGGAFVEVLRLTPNDDQIGAVYALGTALDDPFFYSITDWQITVNGEIYMGPWRGQLGTLVAPHRFPGIAIGLEGAFVLEAANTSGVAAVNAMAVGHGYSFNTPHFEPGQQQWQSYMVDGG